MKQRTIQFPRRTAARLEPKLLAALLVPVIFSGCSAPTTFYSDRLAPEHRRLISDISIEKPTETNTVYAIDPKGTVGGFVAGALLFGLAGGPMMLAGQREWAVWSSVTNTTASVRPLDGLQFSGVHSLAQRVQEGLVKGGASSGNVPVSDQLPVVAGSLGLQVDSYAFVRLPSPPPELKETPWVPRIMVTAKLTTNQSTVFSQVFWNFDLEPHRQILGVLPAHCFSDTTAIAKQPVRATEALQFALSQTADRIAEGFIIHPSVLYLHRLDEELVPMRIDLDGKPFARPQWRSSLLRTIPPGHHTITMIPGSRGGFRSSKPQSVEFNVETGATYHLEATLGRKLQLLPTAKGEALVQKAKTPLARPSDTKQGLR